MRTPQPPKPPQSQNPAGESPTMILGMTVSNFWLWFVFDVVIIGIILAGFLS